MPQLREGALDGLDPQQRARKIEAHNKLQSFAAAAVGQAREIPKARPEVVMKSMHLMPTPFGTQMQVLNTPKGQLREDRDRKTAERQRVKSSSGADKAERLVELKKEFNKTQEKRRMMKRDNNQSRSR